MGVDRRVVSDLDLWRLMVGEFGIVRSVRLLGWLQIWLFFPGRDFRQVVEQESSFATSYRVLSDCRRVAEMLALAEGRDGSFTLREVASRLQSIRPAASAARAASLAS